ncbi:exo-beta-1,3-glucanase [Leptodontidium sp. MPI-SDFR-AT-0119]|nr:exo-beta-1,3-glucanase [Leptodontidium sp. MPI-SDFR-AT-0119]
MSRFIFLSATLLATLVAGVPLDAAPTTPSDVPSLNGTSGIPYFGHFLGNFQPDSGASLTGTVVNGPEGVWTIVNEDGIGEGSDVYRQYWGDGGPEAGWPAKSDWVSFRAMFDNNKAIMFGSCGWNGWGADDSGEEVGQIYNAIQKVALETGVDHRFILATIIQESGGCTRVPTTDNGVVNPGLMQCHNGDGSCNRNGWVQTPCPTPIIEQMVREGTAGTNFGDGLAGTMNIATSTSGWGSRAVYMAARLYNSGSVNQGNMNDPFTATPCYAMDIANRLTGWVLAPHNCPL